MMRFVLLLLIILLPLSAAQADPATYALVADKSSLKFIAIQNNAPVEGQFKDFTTQIVFDPDDLEHSKIRVEIAVASVTSSYGELVTNLKLPEWLSVEAFPKAHFESKKITRMIRTDNYIVEGELSLRDKKIPVSLNFQMLLFEKDNAIAKGFTTLHRSDFGVGQGQWAKDDVVKDEVRVEFRIVAKKQ